VVSHKKNIKIIFRLNFGNKVGLGHLYRCLKIANKIKDKDKIIFVFDKKINFISINKILKKYKIIFLYKKSENFKNQLEDANRFKFATKRYNSKFIIIDDYRFSLIWHKAVKEKNNKIVVIDDLMNRKMSCDFYINYKNQKYKKNIIKKYLPHKCIKLLGFRYNTVSNNLIKGKKKEYVMVNFGNSFDFSEFQNSIYKISEICKKNNVKLLICVGLFSKNFDFLKKFSNNKSIKILYKKFLIEEYLSKTKVFIGSAGSSIYEMSYLNTPSIFLKITKNQNNKKSDLIELGNFFYFKNINLGENFFRLLDILIKFNSRIRKIKSSKTVSVNGIKNIMNVLKIK
tara:strand:+ start:875 stop:1900 length:1026 start_codon:yes stop_codon:yes gene_type:complete